MSLFHSGEGAVLRVETYISIHSGDDLSPLNVARFLKIVTILERKRLEFRPKLQ